MGVAADTKPTVLGLAFQTESVGLAAFEKQLMFGISQTLTFFTDIVFLDHAIPPNAVTVPKMPFGEHPWGELKQMGNLFQAGHIFYGVIEPEIGPTGCLDSIQIEITLLDLSGERQLFQLRYNYTAFNNKQPQLSQFSPNWEGFEALVQWIVFQMVGALQPEKAVSFWRRQAYCAFASNLNTFNKLAEAYYLTNENSMMEKLVLLTGLTQQDAKTPFLAYYELGILYKRMKDYYQATSMLEYAFKEMTHVTSRQRADCATELGICYALSGQREEANLWWKTAIQEDPKFVNPYMNLAHACEEEGSVMEAEHYFKQACERVPGDNRIYFNLARLYSKQQLWDQAIHQYEQQLALEPENAWVYSNLANCYLQKGEITDAKVYLHRTVEMDPQGEAGRCAHFILSGLHAVEA